MDEAADAAVELALALDQPDAVADGVEVRRVEVDRLAEPPPELAVVARRDAAGEMVERRPAAGQAAADRQDVGRAARADRALGIDRSSEMLRLARTKLAAVANAELRQADLYALPLEDGGADTAVLHHVLHFAQQPGAAIAEAARVLAPGGRLLIVDFAPHDREQLRQSDAHVRLGFADDQLLGWCGAAGLAPVRVEPLEGGELTVKLWLARKVPQQDQTFGNKVKAA